MNASTDSKPPLAIFHNMARSGGTMVSKCIGAMRGTRLFSEIHPRANFAEYLNVTDQAARWYRLASPETADNRRPFLDGVAAIHAACRGEASNMVLRDWASVDFIGKVLVDQPVYRFSLNETLAPHYQLNTCALVRHPLDLWLSTRRLKVYTDKLTINEFMRGYLRYVDAIGERFVRYEDFTKDPVGTMQTICRLLAIDFDATFIDRWHLNICITGDNKNTSRGSEREVAHLIRPLSRRPVEPALQTEVETNDDYSSVIKRLGY